MLCSRVTAFPTTLIWLLTAAVFAAPNSTQASSFSVSPVRLSLTPDRPIQALRIRNNKAHALSIETEVVGWTQDDAGDHYTASPRLIVSPPIFSLGPGEEQIVRMALDSDQLPKVEDAFRVFFSEIPEAAPKTTTALGIRVALRLGVPVFVRSTPRSDAQLVARLVHDHQTPSVRLENLGNSHVRILDWRLDDSAQQDAPADHNASDVALDRGQGNLYVLAAHHRSIPLALRAEELVGKTLRLVLDGPDGHMVVPVQRSNG